MWLPNLVNREQYGQKKTNNKEEPIEKLLWKAADKLTKNIDATQYEYPPDMPKLATDIVLKQA